MKNTKEIKCLDKGYVKFIDKMGSEEDIINTARMSTDGGFISWNPYTKCKKCNKVQCLTGLEGVSGGPLGCQHEWQSYPNGDLGLLTYLYKNHHDSPFEFCELVVEMKAPIFVTRQIFRHGTLRPNEHSARYSEMVDDYYLPELNELTKQGTSNKQGSAEPLDLAKSESIQAQMVASQTSLSILYDHYLNEGLAREIARINQPVSQYTKFRLKGNLRNWLNFLSLRKPSNVQAQTRVYADAVGTIIQELWPKTYALFEEYRLYGKNLSRTEYEAYKKWLDGQNPK